MTAAHEFLDRGLTVMLLEAGGMRLEKKTQDLYKGEIGDKRHGDLERYRHRRMGGTTTVCGGRCAPFDEVDFERRSHVPYSGWPIGKRDMDPYYERAHEYCHLGEYSYTARDSLLGNLELIPGFRSSQVLSDRLWRFSPPTDFGKEYLQPMAQSHNITVCLHANALKLVTRPEGNAVSLPAGERARA